MERGNHHPADGAIVLLIEDDAAVLNAIAFALEVEGFHVASFASGEALLAADLRPQKGCLIIDYGLPGMDGLHLLAELRARGIGLPAILIASNLSERMHAKATEMGFSIIEKPLLTDELVDGVRCALM